MFLEFTSRDRSVLNGEVLGDFQRLPSFVPWTIFDEWDMPTHKNRMLKRGKI